MTGSQAKVVAMAVLAGATVVGSAQNNKPMPDAQIESNVLRALAGAPELATQNIQTSVVYGTVTITGNVHDETLRSKAENLVARAEGVKKVVDELALGDSPQSVANGEDPAMANMAGGPPQDGNGQPLQPQPDGSYAPAGPPNGATADNQPGSVPYGAAPEPNRRPMYSRQAPPPDGGYGQGYQQGPPQGAEYGQRAGIPVVVPPGAMVRIRINRGIDSNHIAPGTPFDGTILTDILADGAVAIPRGASVTGVVVDAKATKALSGRGELALQLNAVNLGGQTFPLQTQVWNQVGQDKTASTVNHAVGLGAVGAIFGAVAGGGVGAAVGAGVGAGLGVAASAGGPKGRILVAPESVLIFQTSSPTPVRTVSQQEMQRLAYAAGPDPAARPRGYYRHGYYYPYAPGVVVVR